MMSEHFTQNRPFMVTARSLSRKAMHALILVGVCTLTTNLLQAQVTLQANGPGDTYQLINSVLGGSAVESPDCGHTSFGPHITEAWDNQLGKYVFVFHSHVDEDDDRCTNSDRQRIEIKTHGPSPANVKGAKGETHTYRWKFKLAAGFQPSPNFTHIHQIKAGDGSDDGSPLITITPRAGSPEMLQIIFTPSSGQGGGGTLASTNLAAFKGVWVEVFEKVFYEESGRIELLIRRVSDGATLLSYTNNNLDMWRGDATFNRPKWGVYRSLNSISYLRDEQVLFADFCIAEGTTICPSDVGSNTPPSVSITAPANGASYTAPATIAITSSASDTNGSVAKVEFFNGSTKLGEDTSAPYSFSWTNVAAGAYTLTARATDNQGASTTSSGVSITVESSCQAVVASGDDGNVAANVLDNNLNTRWSASGDGQWIQFCLNSVATVSGVQIAFYKGDTRQGIFDVQLSQNAQSWTTVLSNVHSSGTSLALQSFPFSAQNAKYVRIVGHGNSVNAWNSYTEVRITTSATSGRASVGATSEETSFDSGVLYNYPNPFKDKTTFAFTLKKAGHVSLTVHDVMNNKVSTLLDGYLQEGVHEATFQPKYLPAGIYFARLRHQGKLIVEKILKE
jgi:hypothetical protein